MVNNCFALTKKKKSELYVCAMNHVPLSNTLDHRSHRNSASRLIYESHVWLAQTPSTLSEMDEQERKKPSEAPCLPLRGATAEGGRTHLPSSASMASIVAGEEKEGDCKTSERGEQRRFNTCVPGQRVNK